MPNTSTITGGAASRLRDSRPRLTFGTRRVTRAAWVRVALLAVFAAFYVWTTSSTAPIKFTAGADGVYGQLADAFLHGRVDVGDAPYDVTSLPNPYDPQYNGVNDLGHNWPIHDLSLYDGKLYAYWGPTPVLLLFMPAKLLGISFSQSLAVALFAFLALVFGMQAWLTLVRRFAPDTAAWKVNAGVVLLGLASAMPYTIRRPDKYELAIAAGLCFALLATWLLLSAVLRDGGPDRRRLAWGSLALGLAVGARPSHAVTAVGLVALCAWLLRGTPKPDRRAVLLALLGPVVACGVLLGLYNFIRFDSFTEFGLSYQLAGVDITARKKFDPAYLPPGLWYYLVAPPRLQVLFPFVALPPAPYYPGHVPAVYDGTEPTGGVFALVPLLLGLLVAAPFALRRRWGGDRELRAVVLAFAGIAAGLVVLAAVIFWGTTQRYEVDFATFLLLPALLIWARASAPSARFRRVVAVLGAAAIAWASFVGLALSFTGQNAPLRSVHPKLWASLTRDFSPVSRVAAMVTSGGPTIGEVQAVGVLRRGQGYLDFGDQGSDVLLTPDPVGMTIVMPSAGTAHLTGDLQLAPGLGPAKLEVALPDGKTTALPLADGGGPIDLPMPLEGGLQQIVMAVVPEDQPQQALIAKLDDLRVR